MKHLYSPKYTVVLLFVFLLLPIVSAAQTTGSFGNRWMNRDGSSTSGAVRLQEIQRYRQQSRELRQKINALPTEANPVVLMPVLFGVEVKDISPNFGDPRDGGARTHEGEDIIAVKGTPIVSPTPAVVLRTGVGGSEGNYVYTANPGGETFVYMHLDRIGENTTSGTVLAQGSLIGYVGNTGNASGGPAHLHFEIHSSSGTPTDPFARLTGEISVAEKITDLFAILSVTTDPVALSRFLVTNFRGTFINALAANIALPLPIIDALASVPPAPAPSGAGDSLPAGDLDIGSSGGEVVSLQNYLIKAASGAAATRLAGAGATGYFGIITKAALVEFQAKVGIAPTSGYYGPITRAFIADYPFDTPAPSVPSSPALGEAVFLRDLYRGISGEDVRALQKLLNASGYTVATSGAGSSGEETAYFGPATQAAVVSFQLAHAIMPPAGYFGPITRVAIMSP